MKPDLKGKTNVAEVWYSKDTADALGLSGNFKPL